MIVRKILLLWLVFGFILNAWATSADFSKELSRKSLAYFLKNTHPRTGLVRDRARNFGRTPNQDKYRISSIAATGFGLAVRAHAVVAGDLPRASTEQSLLATLDFVETRLPQWHGWLYHFVDWETGERVGNSEISTIDTALFLAGAYYAATVFPHSAMLERVRRLHVRLRFDVMRTHDGAYPENQTLSMGWTPEQGFIPAHWNIYSEHLILYLLGLGHPSEPLSPQSWLAWERRLGPAPPWDRILGGGLPLFVHQYNFLFLRPKDIPLKGFDLFQNSQLATEWDRRICVQAKDKYKTYRAGYWGLSASDSAFGYQPFSPLHHNGTVCLGCVGGSIAFQPELLTVLEKWAYGKDSERIWGQYGFVDAFNLDPLWFGRDILGITVGALYLSMANATSAMVWSEFSKLEFLRKALRIAHDVEFD